MELEAAGVRRPWTVRVLVAGGVAAGVYGLAVQPGTLNVFNVVFTLVFFGLLKALWDAQRAVWQLFVFASVATAIGSLVIAVDEPAALAGAAGAAAAAALLLAPATQEWIRQHDRGRPDARGDEPATGRG